LNKGDGLFKKPVTFLILPSSKGIDNFAILLQYPGNFIATRQPTPKSYNGNQSVNSHIDIIGKYINNNIDLRLLGGKASCDGDAVGYQTLN
jgi:hypothetical protein